MSTHAWTASVSVALTALAAFGSFTFAQDIGAPRPADVPVFIRGTYANPKPFWDAGAKLSEYGINAIFVHSGAINEELIRRARAEGAKVFAEFATLNGGQGDYVRKHADAHPIDDEGNPARKATWFMGVCPTNKPFREHRMSALRELLTKHDVDGVWMAISTGTRSSRTPGRMEGRGPRRHSPAGAGARFRGAGRARRRGFPDDLPRLKRQAAGVREGVRRVLQRALSGSDGARQVPAALAHRAGARRPARLT